MQTTFAVSLEKEQLIFSAAHFITFGENICERIHGHNYRLACEVIGPLNSQGYVIDFIALRDAAAEIAARLDHRVLLPLRHPQIRVTSHSDETTVVFGNRRWVFPTGDCCLLPVDNTTAERLAEFIASELRGVIEAECPNWVELRVAVDENEGQWGRCQLTAAR